MLPAYTERRTFRRNRTCRVPTPTLPLPITLMGCIVRVHIVTPAYCVKSRTKVVDRNTPVTTMGNAFRDCSTSTGTSNCIAIVATRLSTGHNTLASIASMRPIPTNIAIRPRPNSASKGRAIPITRTLLVVACWLFLARLAPSGAVTDRHTHTHTRTCFLFVPPSATADPSRRRRRSEDTPSRRSALSLFLF